MGDFSVFDKRGCNVEKFMYLCTGPTTQRNETRTVRVRKESGRSQNSKSDGTSEGRPLGLDHWYQY